MQRRELAATLTAQAIPALHVGTLWQGIDENDTDVKQDRNRRENKSSLQKMNIKGNKLNSKEELTIKNSSKLLPRGNHKDMSKHTNISLEESNMNMMKRCQRKMSQTMTSSFHLTVPRTTTIKVGDEK